MPPIPAGRATAGVKERVQEFYSSVAAIFEAWVAQRCEREALLKPLRELYR